jgi:hypothetical protein
VHTTTVNGASASYTFTGTGVSVRTEKNSAGGNVEVYLDGTDKGTFSGESATSEPQQVLYSVSGLTPGSHTIEIVKDSGSYMVLDGLDVTRTINDTDAAITYTGRWSYSAGRGLGDYDNDVHSSTVNGSSVTVTFYGSAISYLTEKYSDEGSIAVSLDGTSEGTVNAEAAARGSQQVLYSVSGLTPGLHTLTLTKESGTYLLVDRFDVS